MSTKREKKTERQTEEEIKEKQRKNRKVKLVPSIALSMFAGIGLALLLVVSARALLGNGQHNAPPGLDLLDRQTRKGLEAHQALPKGKPSEIDIHKCGGVGFEPPTKWRYHPHFPLFSASLCHVRK